LVFKKEKINNWLIMISVLTLVMITSVIIFNGCKADDTQKENIISEPEGEEEVTEEETEEETSPEVEEQGGVAGEEITGNINRFSGLEISDSVKDQRPLAIMINNLYPDARPQSGLIYADIIFEAEDEYGITRYIAVYSSYDTELVAPIRSARIYYAEIARSLDPIYTFFGTHKDSFANAYKVIEGMDIDVLTSIGEPEPPESSIVANASFWRDYNRSSITEHTAAMSTIQLRKEAENAGYSLEGGQSPLRFKKDASGSETGNISDIIIDFSTDGYMTEFKYNSENNNYLKYIAGSPHIDRETGIQIEAKNIIVMYTDVEGPFDDKGHMLIRTHTSNGIPGKAIFFMDGKAIEGTWERSSIIEPFEFKNDNGDIVLFNAGLTWVAIIDSDRSSVSY